MVYDYSKLLGRMKERGITQESLAEAIGRDKGTINTKLNNKSNFTAVEIDSICELLDIDNNDIGTYFFAK